MSNKIGIEHGDWWGSKFKNKYYDLYGGDKIKYRIDIGRDDDLVLGERDVDELIALLKKLREAVLDE